MARLTPKRVVILKLTTQGDENRPDKAVLLGSSHGYYQLFNCVEIPADTDRWNLGWAISGQPLKIIAVKPDGSWVWVDRSGTRGTIDSNGSIEEFEP